MYEQVVGPIPAGMTIDHLCRVRACMRPSHLEAVSHAVNIHRGVATKLTEADAKKIRESTKKGKDLAMEYGVSQAQVSRIRNGSRWPSRGAS